MREGHAILRWGRLTNSRRADLVIFEERIRQNLANMHRLRRQLRLRTALAFVALLALCAVHIRYVTFSEGLSPLAILGLILLYGLMVATGLLFTSHLRSWTQSPIKRYRSGNKPSPLTAAIYIYYCQMRRTVPADAAGLPPAADIWGALVGQGADIYQASAAAARRAARSLPPRVSGPPRPPGRSPRPQGQIVI